MNDTTVGEVFTKLTGLIGNIINRDPSAIYPDQQIAADPPQGLGFTSGALTNLTYEINETFFIQKQMQKNDVAKQNTVEDLTIAIYQYGPEK